FIGCTALLLCGLSASAQSTLGGLYQVVTDASDFAAGDTVVLVSYDSDKNVYVMGTYDSGTGNAFHAINIGTTTEDYLPSTIALDEVNTSGNAYEYRTVIYKKDGVLETIGLRDVNDEYVHADGTSLTLSSDHSGSSHKWTPSVLVNSNYPYGAVCFGKGTQYISYTPDYGFKNYVNAITYSGMRAYCYKKIGTNATLSIGSTGYVTLYYSNQDVVLPDGLTAYTVNVTKTAGVYSLHRSNIGRTVPHGTAVVVEGTANTVYYPLVYSVAATSANGLSAVEGNMLHGTDEETMQSNGSGYYFKFADHATKGVGFYWGAADGAAFMNKAHKAYLFLPEDMIEASISDLPFSLLEEGATLTNSISEAHSPYADSPIYNMYGQRTSPSCSNGLRMAGKRKVIGR
ncbi:MAG: hypothetical protein J6S52_01480, partial [Prevotella sp.]|nr:hypothetical protein [Prevotella sp.]